MTVPSSKDFLRQQTKGIIVSSFYEELLVASFVPLFLDDKDNAAGKSATQRDMDEYTEQWHEQHIPRTY